MQRSFLPSTFFVLLLVIATAHAVSAQTNADSSGKILLSWSPPKMDIFEDVTRPTVSTELIGGLTVSGVPIVLEETSLERIQERFGGLIGKQGDAGDAIAWLCLRADDTTGRWVLWLTSSETAGPTIDGFQWKRLGSNERADGRCHASPYLRSSIELPRGLHLGMTQAEVTKDLGEATSTRHNVLFFWHQAKVMLHEEPFTEENSVRILLAHGIVTTIDVEKNTTD